MRLEVESRSSKTIKFSASKICRYAVGTPWQHHLTENPNACNYIKCLIWSYMYTHLLCRFKLSIGLEQAPGVTYWSRVRVYNG